MYTIRIILKEFKKRVEIVGHDLLRADWACDDANVLQRTPVYRQPVELFLLREATFCATQHHIRVK